jgi:hypothetical protein
MSVDHDKPPALSTAAESDIIGYSAISPAAIVALLLGLASFFAIGNLLLLVLPALAIVAAVLSLTAIARSDGALSGRWVALTGLVLALLFTSAAITRNLTRAAHLRGEARVLAEAWLQLVRDGKRQEAHQWHLPASERQLPGTSLAQFYSDSKPAKESLDQFFQAAPLSVIQIAPRGAKVRYQRVVEQLSIEKTDRVAMLYELDPAGTSAKSPLEFVIVAEHTGDKARGGTWQITAVVEPRDEAAIP